MKNLCLAALLFLISACAKPLQLHLVINTPGITDGVVNLKHKNEIVLTQKIRNGQAEIDKQLAAPGFYTFAVIDANKPAERINGYDIYLEQTDYTVNVDTGRPDNYPTVITSSAIQNELNGYYRYAQQRTSFLDRKISAAIRYLQSPQAAALPEKVRGDRYTSARTAQKQRRDMDFELLRGYINKHPQSKIGAHLMSQMYYPENAKGYAALFEKFPADVKASDDGLKIGNKLNTLLGTMAGAKAPPIVGNTPDGKPFNTADLKNNVTLVEFWQSSSRISMLDHQKMVNGLMVSDYDNKKFGIVSVSLDNAKSAWTEAIKKDELKWPQVSDLKGNRSPNASGWNITKLPTYFLVDNNWTILKADINLIDVDAEVHEYLKKHP